MIGISPSELAGPLGGIIALSFSTGATAGYAFCLRTMYKVLKDQAAKDEGEWAKRVESLERKLDAAEQQIRMLQERLYGGMERQAGQIRDSTVHLLDRGVIRDVGHIKPKDNDPQDGG